MSRLRALGPNFDPDIVARIDAQLASLAADGSVLLAVESGSRAWGFPSPDSDYDCRFIYVRRTDDYLSLFAPRDVIEYPSDGVLDVNGWDLIKALRLMLKGNAVVLEWLTSPFVYDGHARFRDECLSLARQVARPEATARHYLHLGERQRRTYFSDTHDIALKKIFYALRPALALRWLRLHPGQAVAPMHFPTMMSESEVPPGVIAIVDDLLRRKAVTRELGIGPLPAQIAAFIDQEFESARNLWPEEPIKVGGSSRAAADAFFRRWVAP